MQIDLKTVSIEPKRVAFDHLIRRFGEKPASRYQEATYDLQVAGEFHYRPTWAPEQQLYDASTTRIVMEDWYALKDPRQFYYSTYTLTRARQQEAMEANFNYVESRNLVSLVPDDVRELVLQLLTPLRHANWGANQNNTFMCGYGYGTAFTQPCMYHAIDNLGAAQYISRIALLLDGPDALAAGKDAWSNNPSWQTLRRYVEESMVVRDPVELFVAQNVVLDGLLYPLIYEVIVDGVIAAKGGSNIGLLTQFMRDWQAESQKWVLSVMKVMAKESVANKQQLEAWIERWSDRAIPALVPLVDLALGGAADDALSEQIEAFHARMKKAGLDNGSRPATAQASTDIMNDMSRAQVVRAGAGGDNV